LLPFAFLYSKTISTQENKKKLFLSFLTILSNEKKKKYQHNYNILESIKEAGFNFQFVTINENNPIYKKYFYNFIFFKKILKLNPDYIYFYSDKQYKGNYPNIILFYLISKITKCKTITISHDYVWKINYKYKIQNKKIFDVVLAQPYAYFKNKKKIKFAEPWFANKKLLKKPSKNRKYNITFIGRTDAIRKKYYDKLKKNDVNVNFFGPGFGKILKPNEYRKIFSNSKIALSFTSREENSNLKFLNSSKGRTLEAFAFGCLLLEEKNHTTSLLFQKNRHYLEFRNYEDLVNKINIYSLKYNKIGLPIAKKGYNFFIKFYSPFKVWNKIFANLK
jgi:hypothetical protein